MDIGTLIGQYVFPIVACVAMAWYVKDQGDKWRNQLTEVMKQHRDEVKEVTSAITNNTLVIQRLVDLIDKEDR